MKKKLYAILTAWVLSMSTINYAWSTEIIRIYSPYSAGHSATPALRKIIDMANASQNSYKFLLEFRPGGNQIIAVKSIEPKNSLAVIAPAFVTNVDSGQLDQANYVPIHALGNACWAVITNKPFKGAKEFVVGGVGVGNVVHLTALAIGERYGFKVHYVVFRSNYDALVNMAGNNGVELVIDKYEGYEALHHKNSRLQMQAASCPNRLLQAPEIPTLQELGITVAYIFNITVAHKDMPVYKQQDISYILNSATKQIGEQEIFRMSAMKPPVFQGESDATFLHNSITTIRQLQKKYYEQLSVN